MNLQEQWDKALKKTEIVRSHMFGLSSTATTKIPYLFLAESSVNRGDTVVRRGEVAVDKPAIVLPNFSARFDGFEFEENMKFGSDTVLNFLLVRGIRFPSMKYNHHTNSIDLHEGKLEKAIQHFGEELQRKEDAKTTLLVGPEDAWQFSVLIYICMQAERHIERDIRNFMDDLYRRGKMS